MFQLNRFNIFNRLIRLPKTNNYHRYINTNSGANTIIHTPCKQLINQNNNELFLIRKELEDIKNMIIHTPCKQLTNQNNNELFLIRKELEDTKKMIIYPVVAIHNIFIDNIFMDMIFTIGFCTFIFMFIFWGTITLICYMSDDKYEYRDDIYS